MVMKMMRKMRDEVMMMMVILGFHCVQNNGKMSPKFCITIELNSRKTFFAIVLYINMADVDIARRHVKSEIMTIKMKMKMIATTKG